MSKKPVHKSVAIIDANSFWRVQQETFCTAKFFYWLCKLNFRSKSGFLGNPCSNVFNFPAKKLRKNTVPQNTHAPDFFFLINRLFSWRPKIRMRHLFFFFAPVFKCSQFSMAIYLSLSSIKYSSNTCFWCQILYCLHIVMLRLQCVNKYSKYLFKNILSLLAGKFGKICTEFPLTLFLAKKFTRLHFKTFFPPKYPLPHQAKIFKFT